jgi:hypothetical protein
MKIFDQRSEKQVHQCESHGGLRFRASPGKGGRVGTLFLEGSRQWGEERDSQKILSRRDRSWKAWRCAANHVSAIIHATTGMVGTLSFTVRLEPS